MGLNKSEDKQKARPKAGPFDVRAEDAATSTPAGHHPGLVPTVPCALCGTAALTSGYLAH
jgi:hypothetical protein